MSNSKIFSSFILITFLIAGCNQGERAEKDKQDTATGNQQSQGSDVTLKIESTDQLGKYLVDGEGRSLYLFKADSNNTSNCYGACADAWPPLIAQNKPKAENEVDASLINTFKRNDGKMQVSYNGWPLYYYIKDEGAGQRTGQDVKGFGAEWYLVTPEGKAAHKEGHEGHAH